MILPARQPALIVQRGFERMKAARTIVVETHVVLARPLRLDRDPELTGNPGDLANAVVSQPAAEAAAAAQLMQRDAVLRQPEQTRDGRNRHRRRLGRSPDLDRVTLEPGRAILGLEIGMRGELIAVEPLGRRARRGKRGIDVA